MKEFDLATDTQFIPVGDKFMNKLSNGKMYSKEEYKELMRKALEVTDDTKPEADKPAKRNSKRK